MRSISAQQKHCITALTLAAALVVLCAAPQRARAAETTVAPATITSIMRSAQTADAIDIKGKAAAGATVNVEIISDDAGPVLRDQATANAAGVWTLTVGDASFRDGAYTLRAIVQDENGVLGPSTEVRGYKVRPQALLEVNGYRFGWLDAFLILLFLLFVLAGVGAWYYERHRRLEEEKLFMAERDITNMSHNLKEETERLDNLLRDARNLDPHIAAEAEYLLKSQQSKLDKMEGLLTTGVVPIK